jgi:hypothetical protein
MMAVNTQVNIKMIRNMALESTPGLIRGAMKDFGTKVNSMV